MLSLPIEVICESILPHLSVCDLQALDTAFTNKCSRPQLRKVWESYQYDGIGVVIMEENVRWIRNVLNVDISFLSVESDTLASLPNIPTLKKLCATSNYFFADILLQLAANSADLEELNVSGVYGKNTDNAVSALAQNCGQLHTLHIGSKELTDTGIEALAINGLQLQTLHISDAKISDAGIQALCENCPHLKHIGLINCDNLTDASLIAIANSYPNLQSIRLSSYNFTDDGLVYFANKCHELRSVSVTLAAYNSIRGEGLTALWAANPNLMDVCVCGNFLLPNDDIIQLAQCCPLLQKLNISYCTQITDAAVIAVAEHCPQLRALFINNCDGMSDASLIALGQHCHNLKLIDISYLKNISDVGIAALAAGCPLLQEFYAVDTNITDAGVVALARGCRDLFKVEVEGCESIGFAAVSAIAENCPLISHFHLCSCDINDACMYVIAQHCRNLVYLDISNSNRCNADAVILVIKSCRMLREVVCRNCFKEKKDRIMIDRSSRRIELKI